MLHYRTRDTDESSQKALRSNVIQLPAAIAA